MAFTDDTARLAIGRVIEARIASEWTVGGAYRCAIQWPSTLGLIDTDRVTVLPAPPTMAAWLKVDILDGETDEFCYGGTSGMNRCEGIIQLTIHYPRQRGDEQLLTLAGLAKVIFNRYHASGLKCEASGIRKIEPDRGWERAMVRTPFTYFEEVAT